MITSARPQNSVEIADLAPFKELLLRTCGLSFENGREQALSVALRRRMASKAVELTEDYLSDLRNDSKEFVQLVELLTVNETYFFREPEHLNLVLDKLLPELMATRKQKPIRIVSAGCSSGEEPHSIAIMLRERYGADSERLFSVAGVDIDSKVIASAKQGIYGKGSFRGMDRSLLERYFLPCGSDRFQVCDPIRKQIKFEVANLLGSSYPEEMQKPDIIFYRNVSIYFPQQVQREIFGRLAGLLTEGGCLVVGVSETFHHDIGILALIERDSLFYYCKTPVAVSQERRTSTRSYSNSEQVRSGSQQTAAQNTARPDIRQSRVLAGHANPPAKPNSSVLRDVRELFDEAIDLAHKKQFGKAIALLDTIIEKDNTFAKAYGLKGSVLLSASRFDEARSVCEAILVRDPLCLEAYLVLGIIARQNGKDDDAVKRFREAIYLNSSCWPAHFYTAEILFSQRDRKRARSGFESALKILESGTLKELGQAFFPLVFNAEQYIVICRHKLSLMKDNR